MSEITHITLSFSENDRKKWTTSFRINVIYIIIMNIIILAWPVTVTVLFKLSSWWSWFWYLTALNIFLLMLSLLNGKPYKSHLDPKDVPNILFISAHLKQTFPLGYWSLFVLIVQGIIGFLWFLGITISIIWLPGSLWARILNSVFSFLFSVYFICQPKQLYKWALLQPFCSLFTQNKTD